MEWREDLAEKVACHDFCVSDGCHIFNTLEPKDKFKNC
jgi:hypothetical protein